MDLRIPYLGLLYLFSAVACAQDDHAALWPAEPFRRAEHVALIARQQDLPGTLPELLGACDDPDAWVAYEARRGLRQLGWPRVVAEGGDQGWHWLERDLFEGAQQRRAPGYVLEHLDSLLPDARIERRVAAVEALAEIGGRRALELLQRAATDQAQEVRLEVADALGRFRRGATPVSKALSSEAFETLARLIEDPDDYVRRVAYLAVGETRAEGSLELLREALLIQEPFVRPGVLGGLGYHGGDAALALLLARFEGPDRQDVVLAISRIGGVEMLPWLEKAAEGPDCGAVMHGLPAVGGRRAEALLERVAARDAHPCSSWALPGLAQLRGEGAHGVLVEALKSDDRKRQSQAIEGVLRLAPEAAQPLLGMITRDVEFLVLGARRLGNLGEAALPMLMKALESGDPRVRRAAVEGLVEAGGGRAVNVLKTLLTDPDPGVRSRVVRGLASLTGSRAMPDVMPLLSDPELYVRNSAAETLARWGSPRELRELTRAFETEAELEIRRSILRNVGAFGRVSALPLIRRALGSSDQEELKWAVFALGQVGGTEAESLLASLYADKDGFVRSCAIVALGHIGGPRAVKILTAGLDFSSSRPNPTVELAVMDPSGALRLLREAAETGAEPQMSDFLKSLNKEHGAAAVETLRQTLRSAPDVGVRSAVARALRHARGQGFEELMGLALDDPAPEVRREVVDSMGYVVQVHPEVRAYLEKATQDPDPKVADEARWILERLDP